MSYVVKPRPFATVEELRPILKGMADQAAITATRAAIHKIGLTLENVPDEPIKQRILEMRTRVDGGMNPDHALLLFALGVVDVADVLREETE